MRTLYVEPFGGMAGDMFLAALIDLGDPRFTLDDLRGLADRLVPGECRLEIERAWRGNLSGQMLSVRTEESLGESEAAPHRGLAELEPMIARSPLSAPAQERARRVLRRIAEAEARVHGTTPERVHFHEIGAVDTLVDVCGACLALERLGVERVVSRPPLVGTGTVRSAHGEMPVPAPAVAEILRGLPAVIGGGLGERLTPTGAALLAEIAESFEPPGAFVAERVGYGAGHRDPRDGPPNILRVQLGVAHESAARAEVFQLEVNLDDMTGEEIAHALESLRAAGALDVWATPVQMKKGRPGVVVSALCRPEARDALERAVFETTTTFGLRWIPCERTECGRRTVAVLVLGVEVAVKVRERPGASGPEPRDLSPEHDDLVRLCRASGLALREAERRAVEAALERLAQSPRRS